MKIFRQTYRIGKFVALGTALSWAFMILTTPLAIADHNSPHATACDELDTVGGGLLGVSVSSGPSGLGWDVGSGQCNGSFVVTRDPSFRSSSGGGIELGLRIEQRRTGQVSRGPDNEYVVETGPDTTGMVALNRAWWNFHVSTAYDGSIDNLKSLTLTIENLAGPNDPSLPVFDLLAFRPGIDDRRGGGTAEYADIYQISQNPEFGWFAPSSDNDANPTGRFDYDAEGMWRFTLEARKKKDVARVTMCVRTRNAAPLVNSVSPCVASGGDDDDSDSDSD